MPAADFQRTIDAVWRMEAARIIAGLTRIVRDVGLAEDLAQEALVVALERWPTTGIPDNPAAWLMTTAKHRAIDYLRRQQLQGRKHDELERVLTASVAASSNMRPDREAELDDQVGDDLLRL